MPVDEPPNGVAPPSRRLTWVLSFLAFALVGLAWTLMIPLSGMPDEPAHVAKAAATVRGELTWDSRVDHISRDPKVLTMSAIELETPAGYGGLLDRALCISKIPYQDASCAPQVTNDETPIATPSTYVAAYPPTPYLIMGWPSLVLPTSKGVYVMRLCVVALCSALLATALAVGRSSRHARPLLFATVLAATPMVLFLQSAPNPNAMEITASICFAVSCFSLLADRSRAGARDRFVVVAAALSGMTLALVRPVSFGIVVFVALVMAVTFGRLDRIRELIRWRAAQVAAGALTMAMAAAVAWYLYAKPLGIVIGIPFPGTDRTANIKHSLSMLPDRVYEMVGRFGWGDTRPPIWVPRGWLLMILILVLAALVVGTWRQRICLVGLIATMAVLPTVAEIPRVNELGFIWYGRYSLGFAVTIPIVAGAILSLGDTSRLLLHRRLPWLLAPAAIFMAASVFVGMATTLSRFATARPEDTFSFLDDAPWAPQIGATGSLALMTVAAIAYGACLIWLLHPGPAERPAAAAARLADADA